MNFQKGGHGSQALTFYQKLSLLFKILPDEIFASKGLHVWYVSSHCRYFNFSFHTSKLLLIVFSSIYTTLFCLARQTVVSSEVGAVSYFCYVCHIAIVSGG